jgi:hypothetical protein
MQGLSSRTWGVGAKARTIFKDSHDSKIFKHVLIPYLWLMFCTKWFAKRSSWKVLLIFVEIVENQTPHLWKFIYHHNHWVTNTKTQQGVYHTVALPFTLNSILRQKKNYGDSNISPCKCIIFKNPRIKIDLLLFPKCQNPLGYYTL